MPRITRYMTTSGPRYGLVESDDMIYTLDVDPFHGASLEPGTPIGPYQDMLLTPPVEPSKVICVAYNYEAQAAQDHRPVPENPMIFLKPPSSLIGFDMPIVLPPNVGRVELEAELAVVIGQQARKVSEDAALDYVLGYTCGNDVSARVLQRNDTQWGRAKGFDTFGPLGPWITTEIDDPTDLAIKARLNDQEISNNSTQNMIFSVPYLIAWISHVMTLQPGDVILTGSIGGSQPIQEEDTIEIEIEGIGALRNWVETDTDEEG